MKLTPFWASIALLAPRAALADPNNIEPTTTSTTTTAATPSCTASILTTLCDYPDPDLAVASASRAGCWDYCHNHPPCDFAIWARANPYLDTGTCWLYPGETFDADKGSSTGCSNPYLDVYSKPVCPSATTTTPGACAATETPKAIASGCGYPVPGGGDCFNDCYASSGAVNCLSLCAKADSCSYAVFNPGNEDLSPYGAGNCWVYPEGKFDEDEVKTCSGKPEQYVYNNVCPKPSSPSASSSLSSSSSSATERESATGTAGVASDSTAVAATAGPMAANKENSASVGRSRVYPLAIGVVVLIWQAL
ncbi:hypothetical protein FE257_011315 [Aspergillus nanangensis]|uniref:Uncharacterized protein n=1 Tax=Aspergillus nanangensis TaxID=2582783 RepID=A0AAD4GSM0_ASPNN|nr:hypothetical protein FE257_011315 [Aspergillus nanangensis]